MPDSDFMSTAPIPNLEKRARILQMVRRFFDELGFIEVQTPILSQDIVVDRHLDPLTVRVTEGPQRHEEPLWYLQTSPEQNMKRLLASGMTAIYQIGPVFRSGERGRLHNPEFTMVEWYRVGDDYQRGIELLCQLMAAVIPLPAVKQKSYSQVFLESTGLDPILCSLAELAEFAIESKLVDRHDWSDDRDDWCDLIFSMVIQSQLGQDGPVVLTHFPASQAALAKTCVHDSSLAERFEYFYQGLNLRMDITSYWIPRFFAIEIVKRISVVAML